MSYSGDMRTTVTLAADVAAEVERRRRETGAGPSEVINELARRGLVATEGTASTTFVQQTMPLGARVDVTNIGDVLDLLDE